jgi:hypothetical protein
VLAAPLRASAWRSVRAKIYDSCPMIIDVTCQTDRFNLSVIGPDFFNDCCFGEDFSNWLVSALSSEGIEADILCMEDFGWANVANVEGVSYLICIAGTAAGDPRRPNFGEWHVMLERRRTLLHRILGRNNISAVDPLVVMVKNVLQSAGFTHVDIRPRH